MAFDTLTAKLTPLELPPGYVIKFEAINTATGAAVAGVSVSAVAISGLPPKAATSGELQTFSLLDPLLIPLTP